MKICRECGADVENSSVRLCKPCLVIKNRLYYQKNCKTIREQKSERRKQNPQYNIEKAKEWRNNNPERFKELNAIWRSRNKEKIKNMNSKYSEKRRKECTARNKRFRDKVLSYSKGCIKCGMKDKRYLNFDHIDPTTKKCTISRMINRNCGLDAIKQEMRKCQILCVACHTEKTNIDKVQYPAHFYNNKVLKIEEINYLELSIIPCL